MKEDLKVLQQLDADTAIQLIDSAYQYLLDKKSLPLKKLTANVRVPFSAIYSFLRTNPAHRIKDLETLKLEDKVKNALKAKVYLMYAQNYTQVGLLQGYRNELQRVCEKQKTQGSQLNFAGCQWKVNVVLSTNYVNKVLRPEVHLEIQTKEGIKVHMTISVDKFEELRRQVAGLLRQQQQIECVRYIN